MTDHKPRCGVLVVEADDDLREVLVDILQDRGHAVTAVGDLIDAAAAFARARHDLVLVDVVPPRYAELELISALREEAPTVDIVALTSDGGFAGIDLSPVARVLPKPFDIEELMVACRPRRRAPARPAAVVDLPATGFKRRDCAAR